MLLWAWGALEADFVRYYNIDLVEKGLNDRITWHYFLSLVRGLPADSAYSLWLKNKENRTFAEWSEGQIDEDISRVAKR